MAKSKVPVTLIPKSAPVPRRKKYSTISRSKVVVAPENKINVPKSGGGQGKGSPAPTKNLRGKKGTQRSATSRRKGRRLGKALSYQVIPKNKQLARNIVLKLERENNIFNVHRGIRAGRRIQHILDKEVEPQETSSSEIEIDVDPEIEKNPFWQPTLKRENERSHYQKLEQKRQRLKNRALKRREWAEKREAEELERKYYRLHPDDIFHIYLKGYQRTRHRITKKRFMKCVDVPLLEEVLLENDELLHSPLWDPKLNLETLTQPEIKKLKEHMQQYEVIVETLKEGVFNWEGCDNLPIEKVRRKWKYKYVKKKMTNKDKLSRQRAKEGQVSETLAAGYRKRKSFPPFEPSRRDEEWVTENESETDEDNWFNKVTTWMKGKEPKKEVVVKKKKKPQGLKPMQSVVASKHKFKEGLQRHREQQQETAKVNQLQSQTKLAKVSFSESEQSTSTQGRGSQRKSKMFGDGPNPFADNLTIHVPTDLNKQRTFIKGLAQSRKKKTRRMPTQLSRTKEHEMEQRQILHKKRDPFERLHPDDKDSDIWTASSDTSTNSYASWRGLPDLAKGKANDFLAHTVDKTRAWRFILAAIVAYEICIFINKRLDDVYYGVFTRHLYKENIWPLPKEPTVFGHMFKPWFYHLQEYLHLFISIISLSIIHRENECVSLLFAASLTVDGMLVVSERAHDYLFLDEEMGWLPTILNCLHILWKVTVICLFIAYHYYSAGYIRKAREFRHRKTTLHNHEIQAKGTKGIQKRKIAWDWMIQHARNTTFKKMRQEFPEVKDGRFPIEKVKDKKLVKFSESKELRIYAQRHNLKIGYPYNKLADMEKSVFGELEESEYTGPGDDENENETYQQQSRGQSSWFRVGGWRRKSSGAVTEGKWRKWKSFPDRNRRTIFGSDWSEGGTQDKSRQQWELMKKKNKERLVIESKNINKNLPTYLIEEMKRFRNVRK